MINRNEVIEWLNGCVHDTPYCNKCPYNDHVACKHFLMEDALALLKEQKTRIDELEDEIALVKMEVI